MNSSKKPDFDLTDIIAMIIAAFQVLLPPILIMFGLVMALYLLLKLLLGI